MRTIVGAHVLVKLTLNRAGLVSGSTASVLAVGFLIASLVPTTRLAQPLGAMILYPMLALSELLGSIDARPPPARVVATLTPLTYAVSLLEGIWTDEDWLAHAGDVAALTAFCGVCHGRRREDVPVG